MENLASKISTTLKSLRQERGWSLDAASKQTGVSKAMLGQIERGESSPTISTLWKIASGFQTSFSSFIEETTIDPTLPAHRISDMRKIHPNDDKIRVMPLFAYDEKLFFEVFIIELLPGCEHLSPPHKGDVIEHVIAVDGAMEVLINGTWHPLKKNEGLRFNANQPHGYRNTSSKKVTFHDMIHYQKI